MLFKKYGINLEIKFGTIKAKAENNSGEGGNTNPKGEGDTNKNTNNTNTNKEGEGEEGGEINYEDLIAKARKEEKDKMYKKVEDIKKQLKNSTEIHNKTLIEMANKDNKIEELQKQVEAMKQSKATPEDVEKLTSTIQTLQLENQQLKDSQVDVEALTKSINDEWEVKLYREQKLREVGNTVIPELVTGKTKEEIDASIEASQQRFTELVGSVKGSNYIPPTNVNTSKYTIKDVNPNDISNMSMEEWAKQRVLMGLK